MLNFRRTCVTHEVFSAEKLHVVEANVFTCFCLLISADIIQRILKFCPVRDLKWWEVFLSVKVTMSKFECQKKFSILTSPYSLPYHPHLAKVQSISQPPSLISIYIITFVREFASLLCYF